MRVQREEVSTQRAVQHERLAPAAQAERVVLPRWLPPLLGLVAVALVPWTLWLTFSLPARHVTHHYRVAWVGFDVALAAAFATTAIAALRFSRWLHIAAAVTGTLLVCDAWFDWVTAGPGWERLEAGLEATFGELPLAALCAWVVWDVQRFEASVIYRYAQRLQTARSRVVPRRRGTTDA